MGHQEYLKLDGASEEDMSGLAGAFEELSKYSPVLAPHFKEHIARAVIELKKAHIRPVGDGGSLGLSRKGS